MIPVTGFHVLPGGMPGYVKNGRRTVKILFSKDQAPFSLV